MDFELYMAIKNNPSKPTNNKKNQKKESENSKKVLLPRKSLTPTNKKK